MTTVNPDEIAKERLAAFVERIERLHDERDGISDDIKEVYAEAKGNGFDVKVLKHVLQIRRMDPDKRAEHETILELYLQALGMPS